MKRNLWKIIISIFVIVVFSLILVNTVFAPSDLCKIEEHPHFERTEVEKIDIDIIYEDVVENSEKVKTVKIENSEKIIAEEVLKLVGDTKTTINCVHTVSNKEYISIDFSSNSNVLHTGSAGELAVLNSLEKTFKNLGYKYVFFTVDEKQYISGHIEWEVPPYMIEWKSSTDIGSEIVGEFD